MLYLISVGLHDEKDMSLRALEAVRQCDILYAEFYTTAMNTSAEKIGRLVGKEVTEIKRKDLEENSEKIIEEARNKKVGIFVGGDALIATTHISLILEARKRGIETKIIHGSSIYSSVAECGLHIYNFGKTTTIPLPEKNYNPTTFYETIAQNKKMGLHTLILLDVKGEEKKYMNVREGLEILMNIEKKKGMKLFQPKEKIVSICMLGSENKVIKYETIENLMKDKTLENKTPAVLIVPGKLHFMEKEFLENF